MVAEGDVRDHNGKQVLDGTITSKRISDDEISTTLTIDRVGSIDTVYRHTHQYHKTVIRR